MLETVPRGSSAVFVDPLARRAVTQHPLLSRSLSADEARVFMEHHVFAVWDFMTLLKRLQGDLAGTTLPWRPPAHPEHARFVNEIVLGEETDEDGLGGHASHFETYLAAMTEAGANRGPIDRFLLALHAQKPGEDPRAALASCGAPAPSIRFVQHTLSLAMNPSAPTAAVAASFFHGRESIVPEMFRRLLASLEAANQKCARLRWYLARHVEVDEGQHGPMAERLLASLTKDEATRALADQAATESLHARRALWDGVLAAMLPSADYRAESTAPVRMPNVMHGR